MAIGIVSESNCYRCPAAAKVFVAEFEGRRIAIDVTGAQEFELLAPAEQIQFFKIDRRLVFAATA